MNPKKIIETILLLSRLLELETLDIALQAASTKEKIENLKLKALLTKGVYRQYGDLILDAAIEKAAESKEILDLVRIEIKKTEDQLLSQSND